MRRANHQQMLSISIAAEMIAKTNIANKISKEGEDNSRKR
jgi:hypothetical protein